MIRLSYVVFRIALRVSIAVSPWYRPVSYTHLDVYKRQIALNWALNECFEKIVVITTRQKGFRKAMPGQKMVDLYDDFYSDKPLFLADMLTLSLIHI